MNHTTQPQDAVCDTCEHDAHQSGQCQGASISRITGCHCQAEQPAVSPSVVVSADRATLLREAADFVEAMNEGCGQTGCGACTTREDVADALRDVASRVAAEAAVTPPPALTEAGRLRAQVEVLQQDAERDQGLAKVGARCMRDGHQGLIEGGRMVLEGWRFALSTALDLGTVAPWEAIHERAKELRRVAAEEQPTETQDGEVDADTVAERAAQVISTMGADIRALTQERNRYRTAWRSARERAQASGQSVLLHVAQRNFWQMAAEQNYRLYETQAGERGAEARIRALHQQYRFAGDDTTDYCAHCNQISGGWIPWPCPTIAALDAERPNNAEAQAACGRPASIEGPCSAGDWCCTGPAVAEQPDTHRPLRGDAVETWLKTQRDDRRDDDRGQWTVLDQLLDLYRLHADTNTPLAEQPDTQTREAFVPPAHYRGRDGTAYCVHATPIGPDSCRHCRELAE